jgi:arabinogalactan oligomer/maltooligosaccharide transport system substrate-binding protein
MIILDLFALKHNRLTSSDIISVRWSFRLLDYLVQCWYSNAMSRCPSLLITFLISASLALTACSRSNFNAPDVTPTPTPQLTTIPVTQPATPTLTPTPQVVSGALTIWHSWDESETPGLVQVILGFQQLYPDVLFDVLYVPAQDLLARYVTETREGGGPAILLGPAEWGPGLYDSGLLADLSPLLSSERLSALNQAALEAARYQNALIGAPYAIQGVVLYRNKDIITISPATFDELVTLAQTSTQGEVIGAILERSFFFSGGHLFGLDGKLMDENKQPAFNDPIGVAWANLLLRFSEAGPPNYFTDDDVERFKKGVVGWIIDGTWNLRHLASAIGPENLAIDPWPGYEDGHLAGFVMAENLYLSANTPPETRLAAQTFIEYFLSPEAQTFLAETGRIPASSGVSLTDPVMGPLIAQAMAALAGGAPYPVVPEMTHYNLNLDIALRSIFEQGIPPGQALETAAAEIRRAISESTPTVTPNP